MEALSEVKTLSRVLILEISKIFGGKSVKNLMKNWLEHLRIRDKLRLLSGFRH